MHRIETTYTEDDFVKLSSFIASRIDSIRKEIRNEQIAFVVLTVYTACVLIFIYFFDVRWLSIGSTVGFWIGWSFGKWAGRKSTPREMNKQHHLLRLARKCHRMELRGTSGGLEGTPLVWELRDDGIFRKTAQTRSTHAYWKIGKIVERAGCVYVLAEKSILVFPRDRIPDETLDAFIEELKMRVKLSKTKTFGAFLNELETRVNPSQKTNRNSHAAQTP